MIWDHISSLHLAPQHTSGAQVVGDLAQFMVQNNLTEASIVDQADQLSIPNRC